MKRFLCLLAAVSALFCLQSCNEGLLGNLVDAFAKHYYAGDEVMFVESATFETSTVLSLERTCITLIAKDDPTKKYMLTAAPEAFGKETEAKEFLITSQGKESSIAWAGGIVVVDGPLKTIAGTNTITSGARIEGTVTSSGSATAYTIKSKDLYVYIPDKDGNEIKIDMNFCYIGPLTIK